MLPGSRWITAAASRSIPVTLQTDVPHIYAAGDVIGFPALASTSMEQGRVAACHAFGMRPAGAAGVLPLRHLFGARDLDDRADRGGGAPKGIPYEVGIARFRETSRGHIMGCNSGMMKMIFSTEDPPPARRAHRRRGRDRADPYRPGGAQPQRHDRLFHPEHLQLSRRWPKPTRSPGWMHGIECPRPGWYAKRRPKFRRRRIGRRWWNCARRGENVLPITCRILSVRSP
jgi:hypothetical protein